MAAKIDGPAPPFMVDVNGSLVMERWPEDDTNPRPIRYLPVLVRIELLSTTLHPADV